jgi:hypothetical protein
VHTEFEFDFETDATPDQVIALMIDFSPNRPNNWPALSEKTFEVYRVGDTDADIREGQDFPKLRATWHYDWSTPGSVTLTVVDGDAIAAGSYMTMTATPTADGRRREFGARDVGPDLEERQRVARGGHDAPDRPPVPGVVLQAGVRRAGRLAFPAPAQR